MYRKASKILLHLTLWSISFLLLYKLFTIDYDSGFADVLYTALFHVPLLGVVYVNLLLIKLFFVKGQYVHYLLVVLILLLVSVGLYFLIFRLLVPVLLQRYYFIAYYSPWQIAQFLLVYLFLSLLFHLSVGWFFLREKEYKLQKENHQVQLRNLKAQINPHFLFNSLNNIYALVGSEKNLVRGYLTKLSDALRYMIYETDEEIVPLKNEVAYLENYFDLERLRLSNQEGVQFVKTGKFDEHLIAPLLLLPLVENCFRHCDLKNPMIQVHLSLGEDHLRFHSRNNKSGELSTEAGGVGLENVRKRLELIYGSGSQLIVQDKVEEYSMDLVIRLTSQ